MRIAKGWFVFAGLLAIAAVILAIAWPFYFSPMAKIGRNAGFNPPTYVVVRMIAERAANQHDLSPAEMITIRSLANDKDPFVRVRALTALFPLTASNQAGTAAEIARAHIADKDPLVRQYALSVLARLHTIDRTQVAKQMLNDPAENVRDKAKTVLSQK